MSWLSSAFEGDWKPLEQGIAKNPAIDAGVIAALMVATGGLAGIGIPGLIGEGGLLGGAAAGGADAAAAGILPEAAGNVGLTGLAGGSLDALAATGGTTGFLPAGTDIAGAVTAGGGVPSALAGAGAGAGTGLTGGAGGGVASTVGPGGIGGGADPFAGTFDAAAAADPGNIALPPAATPTSYSVGGVGGDLASGTTGGVTGGLSPADVSAGIIPGGGPSPLDAMAGTTQTWPDLAGTGATTGGGTAAPAGDSSSFLSKWGPSLGIGAVGLGANLISPRMAPKLTAPLPYQSQLAGAAGNLSNLASSQTALGTTEQNAAATGQLPAPYQQVVDNAYNDAVTTTKAKYAAMGQTGSTMEADAISSLTNQKTAMGATIAAQLGALGNTAINNASNAFNLQDTIYQTLMNATIAQDTALSNAIATFTGLAASGGANAAVKSATA